MICSSHVSRREVPSQLQAGQGRSFTGSMRFSRRPSSPTPPVMAPSPLMTRPRCLGEPEAQAMVVADLPRPCRQAGRRLAAASPHGSRNSSYATMPLPRRGGACRIEVARSRGSRPGRPEASGSARRASWRGRWLLCVARGEGPLHQPRRHATSLRLREPPEGVSVPSGVAPSCRQAGARRWPSIAHSASGARALLDLVGDVPAVDALLTGRRDLDDAYYARA